jgi:hypothetical protein
MDTSSQWVRVTRAASSPDLLEDFDERADLVRVALALGASITADSVGASVTMSTGGGYATPAASGGVAMTLDLAQYAAHDGPCIAACRVDEPQLVDIRDPGDSFQAFKRVALDRGVLSSLSLPLATPTAAALNLYAGAPHTFQAPHARATADLLARCIARLLPDTVVAPHVSSTDETRALRQRRTVIAARDRVAERERSTAGEAFTRLAVRSRAEHRSIVDVAAAELASTSDDPGGSTGDSPDRAIQEG